MVIYQPERELLYQSVRKNAKYIFGDVLDVGAGPYHRYRGLFKKIKSYRTLDTDASFSPDIAGSATAIPLPDASVDAIVCTQVLGDIEIPSVAVREFSRVLREGGHVLLTESLFGELHDEPQDYWRFTEFGLRKLFEDAGFVVLVLERRGGFFTVMFQMRIRYLINLFGLYQHWWGVLCNPFFRASGWIVKMLDRFDPSSSNKKFTLGYTIVAKKL